MKVKKDRPLGIKILSVLFFLGFIFLLLLGIISFISSYLITNNPTVVEEIIINNDATEEVRARLAETIATSAPFLIWFGVYWIALAILNVFLGFGFWKAQNWARITTLILCSLGMLSGIMGLVFGVFYSMTLGIANVLVVVTSGIVIWYLLRKHVIAYFEKKNKAQNSEGIMSLLYGGMVLIGIMGLIFDIAAIIRGDTNYIRIILHLLMIILFLYLTQKNAIAYFEKKKD